MTDPLADPKVLEQVRAVAAEDVRWRLLAQDLGLDPELLRHGSHPRTRPQSRSRVRVWWVGLAAAIVLAVGGAFIGYRTLQQRSAATAAEPRAQTIATARGQRMSLRLADGTQVMLAPASTLRYTSTYGIRDRALELVGQAAFTVVHDAHRPFVVRAGDLVATDLGTEFVVRAYPGDRHAQVIVREGLVAIRDSVLRAGQRGYLSPAGRPVVQPADTSVAFAWMAGDLVFRRTRLEDVVAEVSRWHDIDVRLASPELAPLRVTASFGPVQGAASILRALATTFRLKVEQTGPRSYTLVTR